MLDLKHGKKGFMKALVIALTATVLALLSGCDRYRPVTLCANHFQPGEQEGFVLDEQGSALDIRTGTRWFRCNAGQRYSGGQCLGDTAYLSLQEAMRYAEEFSAASGKAWRLPTQREMGSLKQTACVNPALNTQVFVGAVVDNYWTSSASANKAVLACTTFTYNGNGYCRELASNARPFMLVLDR